MKKCIVTFFYVFFIFGCFGNYIGAPPFPPDLCVEFDQYKDQSLLLNIQKQYNIPLNEVYYGLVDTSRIMIISDVVDKEWINEYLDKVAIFYDKNYPNLTHDQLIAYMVSGEVWGEKVELAISILSTRIGYFRSSLIINPFDDCMYRNGWSGVKKLLFIQ